MAVGEAMKQYLYHHNANTHWQYPTSLETDQIILEAREAYADLFRARSRAEIVFGLNMTTLTMHVARSLGRQWGPQDRDCGDGSRPSRQRGALAGPHAGPRGCRQVCANSTPPRVSSTSTISIAASARAHGSWRWGAHRMHWAQSIRLPGSSKWPTQWERSPMWTQSTIPRMSRSNVQAWNCDFLVCSAYKLYGPHLGVLFGRYDLLAGLDVPKLEGAPAEPPERLETGTQNHEGIAGAGAAVDFVAGFAPPAYHGVSRRARLEAAYALLHGEGELLVSRLWDGLSSLPSVRLYGPPPGRPRTPTVSFTVRDLGADDVARRLADRAIFVSSGDFYATTVVERLGVATADSSVLEVLATQRWTRSIG